MWVAEYGGADAEPLLHAERVASDPAFCGRGDSRFFQGRIDAAQRQAFTQGKPAKVVTASEGAVDRIGVEQCANDAQRRRQVAIADAGDQRTATIRLHKPERAL